MTQKEKTTCWVTGHSSLQIRLCLSVRSNHKFPSTPHWSLPRKLSVTVTSWRWPCNLVPQPWNVFFQSPVITHSVHQQRVPQRFCRVFLVWPTVKHSSVLSSLGSAHPGSKNMQILSNLCEEGGYQLADLMCAEHWTSGGRGVGWWFYFYEFKLNWACRLAAVHAEENKVMDTMFTWRHHLQL